MKAWSVVIGLVLMSACAKEVPRKIVVDEKMMTQMVDFILADSATWSMLGFMEPLLVAKNQEVELNQVFTFDDSVAISRGRGSMIFYCMINHSIMSRNQLKEEGTVRYYSQSHEEEIRDCLERSFLSHCENFTSSNFPDKTYLLSLENIPGDETPDSFRFFDQPRPYFFGYGIEEFNVICVRIFPTPTDEKRHGPYFGGQYYSFFILDELCEEIIFFASSYSVP